MQMSSEHGAQNETDDQQETTSSELRRTKWKHNLTCNEPYRTYPKLWTRPFDYLYRINPKY